MGRISDIVPALYYSDKNRLEGFLRALDPEIDEIEKKIRGVPELIDVDRCPDDKLPYLASMLNCPLVGESPSFWRKQIRNWPYLLKLKGTERSLVLALESVGADHYAIYTYFRDAGGGYVTEKPEGAPYYNATDGLWRNIRTHYFGVEVHVGKEYVEEQGYLWTVDDIQEKLAAWIERAKPFHAELLNLLILPPDLMPDDHVCIWDWDTWDHGRAQEYEFGSLSPVLGVGELDPLLELAATIWRATGAVCDRGAVWDCVRWEDALPAARSELIAAGLGRTFFAALDWGAAGPPAPWWSEQHDWDHGWTWDETTLETATATDFSCRVGIEGTWRGASWGSVTWSDRRGGGDAPGGGA